MTKRHDLRTLLGAEGDYVDYCREERNFAAVLYHLLLDEKRLEAFLALIELPPADTKPVGVYFEYAHLRDLWANAAKKDEVDEERNARYRAVILSMLGQPDVELPKDCKKFNELFIGEGSKAVSDSHIQMPSRWSDSQFRKWCDFFGDRWFAERACAVKWAFNAKPDLVLHLGNNKALCIEAKLESGVGRYNVNTDHPGGCFNWKQTRLQEFILDDLLGYDTDEKSFVMISKKKAPTKGRWRSYTWHEVFDALLSAHPTPISESPMVAEFRKSRFIKPA